MDTERFPIRNTEFILVKMGIDFVKQGNKYFWDEFKYGETIEWVDICEYTGQIREYNIQRRGQCMSFGTIPLSTNLANEIDLMFTNVELTKIIEERKMLFDNIKTHGGKNCDFAQLSNFDDYISQLKELVSAYENKNKDTTEIDDLEELD